MKKNSFQLTNDVKLLQKAVLKHSDRFLLLKRSTSENSRPLKWDLPGGNSQWPEVSENTFGLHKMDVVREIKEETGIEVSLDRIKKENLSFFETFFDVKKEVFSVIIGWKVELPLDFDESSVRISNEHIEYRWVSLDELSDFDFGGKKGEFIVRMIKNACKS